MIELFDTDDGSALGKTVASKERPSFALPDDKLSFFTLMTLYTRRLGRRLGGQDVAFFIELEGRLAVGIVRAT